ncbi:MAG: hypothetical protein EXS14_06830 [Planctomycetes bacterium]|nr:hypothetical protein [Planctomycetota bacterium]
MTPSKPLVLPFRTVCALVFLLGTIAAQSDPIPSPREHFGFDLGSDRRLLSWAELAGYYQRLADASPYLRCETLGTTTEGRPMLLLTLSSRSDQELSRIERMQRRVASTAGNHGATVVTPEELSTLPAVVYIQGTLHSVEIAASLLFPDLLYRLATGTDALAQRIRDNVVLLVAPSANPDGIDRVNTWYTQTLGTPWEGTTPPALYQTYAGHDNNRDWFMLSLRETQLVSKLLYKRWCPEVVLDIHQMGSTGARMFVPPCSDPLNENVSAMVTRQIDLVGAHMAWALQQAGCSGVVQDVVYDNYWAGGARNTPCRHNMVGIITETASARLATPAVIELKDLRGHGGGFPEYRRQGNFPDPWLGGTWRMSDILRYETISTLAMLDVVSRYHESFVMDFAALNRDAVRRGNNEAPGAFLLPSEGADPRALARLANVLMDTGIDVHRAEQPFMHEGKNVSAGSLVVRLAQPFRAHAKDVLEVQNYPKVRFTKNGDVIRPYDSAGWCLPLQFGLECHTLEKAPAADAPLHQLSGLHVIAGTTAGVGSGARWRGDSNAAFVLANRVRARGAMVRRNAAGDFVADDIENSVLAADSADLGLHVTREDDTTPKRGLTRTPPRTAIFQSWPASMDGGWTRLVLEEHGYAPRMVSATEINAGALRLNQGATLSSNIDVLILPDISPNTLAKGPGKDRLPAEWLGGLEGAGEDELSNFVKRGGRLVAMGSAVEWLTKALKLPVENGLAKAPREGSDAFVCPGSLLRTVWPGADLATASKPEHWLLRSMPNAPTVYFDAPFALRCTSADDSATPLLSFTKQDALRSGYLEGEKHLEGLHALVACHHGAGEVVLFAMRPQHRSQMLGTFRLLFEAIEGP